MPTAANRPPRHDQRLIGDRLGANNADNEYVSDAVVANRDGSILERLEDLRKVGDGTTAPTGLPASYNPVLGYKVTKDSTIASAPDALFDFTGLSMVTLMIGIVSSAIGTSTSMSLNTSTEDQVVVASTQVTTDAIGTVYLVSGDPDLGFSGGGTPIIDGAFEKVGTHAPFYMNDDQIEMNVNTAGTGLITWHLWYWPLATGASVAAAA